MIRKIVVWNARHNFGVGVVLKFDAYLKKLVDDKDVKFYSLRLVIFGDGLKTFKGCSK
ncbi:MAG: hypothetical protein MIO93_00740 [ANME-2 cluster archaeon]|nr:hypothetical protein [ANME-2 cluster archaeon]